MYGPELFLFMCRMGAAAVGCRMDAVLFEEHVKCFSLRRTARLAVTPSVGSFYRLQSVSSDNRPSEADSAPHARTLGVKCVSSYSSSGHYCLRRPAVPDGHCARRSFGE